MAFQKLILHPKCDQSLLSKLEPHNIPTFEAMGEFSGSTITFTWQLSYNPQTIDFGIAKQEIPQVAGKRKDNLWKSTCFEAFFGPPRIGKKPAQYFEVNLSPIGDWNIYSFEDYRHNMRTVTEIKIVNFISQSIKNAFGLITWNFKLDFIFPKITELEVYNLTMVLKNESVTWHPALSHFDTVPNFHLFEDPG